MRTVVWVSAGAASAVAAKLTPHAVLAYCETGAEHPDNQRFLEDVEGWTGRPVHRIRSQKYSSTWDVWEKRRFMAGPGGALCTTELKIAPRLAWQRPDDVHVFGYTCDKPDQIRAERMRLNWPEMQIRTPLIDAGLTKAACLAMIERANIALPPLYAMGFQNNNCIPCVKATSPAYWALVRKKFPDEFARVAKLARELEVRLCRIDDERRFIDEIPEDQSTTDPIQPACDFLCALAEMGL